MNLLFFTVELERSYPGDRPLSNPSRPVSAARKGRFGWIPATIGAVICAAGAAAAGWVLAGGGPLVNDLPDWLPGNATSASTDAGGKAQVTITSQPDNATVFVDGGQKGKTPLSLALLKGMHTLMVTDPAAVDNQRQLNVTTAMDVTVNMWRRRPVAMQLKPAYPGASISSAAFLADGRLALSMAVPGRAGNPWDRMLAESWIFDPTSGSLVPFIAKPSNPRAAIVSVSPDARNLAYVQPNQSDAQTGIARPWLDEVSVASEEGSAPPRRVFTLPPVSTNRASGLATASELEEVHDVAWTPDGRHLLLTVRLVGFAGGDPASPRTRLLLVDVNTGDQQLAPPVELLTLPAEVVAASYSWAPDGNWVAFLTQATSGPGGTEFVALCALDISAGGAISGFRYVADLGRQSDPLPVAAVAWSPAGYGPLVFAAPTPKITVSNPLGLPTTSGGEPGLFVAAPAATALIAEEGQRLGSATDLIAPEWLSSDGILGTSLIALARSNQGSRPLVLRGIDPVDGIAKDVDVVLPAAVGGSGAVAARWDLGHGRLLVLAHRDNSNSGLLDYWLVQLRAQAGVQ